MLVRADVCLDQRGVHPRVGAALQRAVAPAVGSDSGYGRMHLPQPASLGDGVCTPVLEHEEEIERVHQTVPWPRLEVGVVPNARGDRRVGDLKQKRIQRSQ